MQVAAELACDDGWPGRHLHVTASGGVVPCYVLDDRFDRPHVAVDNIRERTLAEIWGRATAKR
jgi:hypothetical protein